MTGGAYILGSNLRTGTLSSFYNHVKANPVNSSNVTSLDIHSPQQNATYCVPWIPNVSSIMRKFSHMLTKCSSFTNSAQKDYNAVSSSVQTQRPTRGIVEVAVP